MYYRRVILKLSGESLSGSNSYGIDPEKLLEYCQEIKSAVDAGVELGLVVGGGNIFRGIHARGWGIGRIRGDYMGMLATMINSLALQDALESMGVQVKVTGALPFDPLVEKTSAMKVKEYLARGYVVLISGGTGNPYFTTDTAAALRAVEIQADAILKGTRVDGIFTADPEKYPDARKFDHLTFDEALERKLQIMDLTAFTLCRENNMPIHVFNMNQKGNLLRVLMEGQPGTRVSAE